MKLDDKEGGALWKLYDADELKKEVAREREAKEEKERAKREAKEEAARKAAEKEARAKVPPSEMFKTFSEYEGLYSKYDDDGVADTRRRGRGFGEERGKETAQVASTAREGARNVPRQGGHGEARSLMSQSSY